MLHRQQSRNQQLPAAVVAMAAAAVAALGCSAAGSQHRACR
jgi:hypothetical protein